MRRLLIAAALIVLPAAVQAQSVPKQDLRPTVGAPAKPVPKTREARLDELFDRLAKSPDADAAKPIVQAIEMLWAQSGSDTVDLLMSRAAEASKDENKDDAITVLDSVVDLAPDYAEGWNRRATMFFLKKDYERSLLDIREVLAHEPRHFGAWAGLGRILQDVGNDKRALAAYRKALALNPHLDGMKKMVENLSIEVEGRDI
jgi:tetratricopeptide (TPR) repeat protein